MRRSRSARVTSRTLSMAWWCTSTERSSRRKDRDTCGKSTQRPITRSATSSSPHSLPKLSGRGSPLSRPLRRIRHSSITGTGGLSPHNVRRTFRDFLNKAGLQDSGITPRWYRRAGATVIARGASVEAASHYLRHGSTAITEGHYIEPNTEVDRVAAALLERTLRAAQPDDSCLKGEPTPAQQRFLEEVEAEDQLSKG